jgi:drug/metabolite transporter (DMT)-like permease
MTAWLLVAGVVLSTVLADLLQSGTMKRHGAITNFRPGPLGVSWVRMFRHVGLVLSVVFMASSFFCFLRLLEINDLSFAVPATAATIVVESVAARCVLGEVIPPQRWVGVFFVAVGVFLLL